MAARDLVTGAFGYTGSRIAERLLAGGRQVATLTRRSVVEHPLAARVERLAYDFGEDALGRALDGVDTVYVTYWMRFPRGGATWEQIVENVARLARASAAAGVRRLVYISVSNAAHDSSTAYFRAKAAAEDAVRSAASPAATMTAAIVRPTPALRRGRHPDQQHGLDAAETARVRDSGQRLVPGAAGPRRRRRRSLCGARRL